METPQRFEGASIEEVLGRVRAELGNDAEIVEANKVRSGGIGGFFSKERYEVLALPVPGAAPSGTPALRRPTAPGRTVGPLLKEQSAPADAVQQQGPVSLLDIAERVSAAETAGSDDATASLPLIGATPPPARSRAQQVAEQVMAEHLRQIGAQPQGHVDPADFQPFQPAAMPHISTESDAFTQVLHRIASDAGHEIAQAVEEAPAEAPRPVMPPVPAGAMTMSRAATSGRPVGPVMTQVNASAQQLRTGADPRVPEASSLHRTRNIDQVDRTDGRNAADLELTAVAVTAVHAGPEPVEPEPVEIDEAPDSLPVPRQMATDPAQSRTERLLSWLELDHLPRTTLMSALRPLPQMESLPLTTGVVVAVVGERRRALRLCRQLARACDSDPRDVVLASSTYRGSAIPAERRIIDLTDAERDRRGWRRRSAPTFVAVESSANLDPQAQSWTRGIVEALDAHQVIGIVQAARKAEDIRAWAEVVGGVDGLALEELAETTTPYAVLALEIPVAFLADEPATPASWAQLLLQRSAA